MNNLGNNTHTPENESDNVLLFGNVEGTNREKDKKPSDTSSTTGDSANSTGASVSERDDNVFLETDEVLETNNGLPYSDLMQQQPGESSSPESLSPESSSSPNPSTLYSTASSFLSGFIKSKSSSTTENDAVAEIGLSDSLLENDHMTGTTGNLDSLDIDNGRDESIAVKTRYSLAFSPMNGTCTRLIVSFLAILAHCLFLYGQTAPMWSLTAVSDVDVWANATTFLSKKTFSSLGLDNEWHLVYGEEHEFVNFTYAFGIKQLWEAKELSSIFWARVAAIALILFSGIWPHVKLFFLHLGWFIPQEEKGRSTCFYWLGAFGKWTLADVFVICVMVGVVNLSWVVDPGVIKSGVVSELPIAVTVAKEMYSQTEACNKFLGYSCDNPDWQHKVQCQICKGVVNEAYNHPEWSEGVGREILNGVNTSGGGTCQMHVKGLLGVHAFCIATIISLLLSCFLDHLDHKARIWTSRNRRGTDASIMNNSDPDPDLVAAGVLTLRPLPENCSILYRRIPYLHVCSYIILALSACVTAFMVAFAVSAPTMSRSVDGAFPQILHDVLGIDFSQDYSLSSLVEVSGEAGGLDTVLMLTFGIFVAVGPILRGVLCVIYLLVPLTQDSQQSLVLAINSVGSFCAWEVFVAALYMVQMEMADITNTLIILPECVHISEDGSCLEVEFDMMPSFGLIILGGLLLLMVSVIGVRLGFQVIDPYKDGDSGGPYCNCCCCFSCCCHKSSDHEYDEIMNYEPATISFAPQTISLQQQQNINSANNMQQQQQQLFDHNAISRAFEDDTVL